MERVAIVVQARMGSTRLPGKVLKPIGEETVIGLIIKRLKKSKYAENIIIATTDKEQDDVLVDYCKELNVKVSRGETKNVLRRYIHATSAKDSVIVRITGDCPYCDAQLIDSMVEEMQKRNLDYYSNVDPPTFPDGIDVEIIKREALVMAERIYKGDYYEEHVTTGIRESTIFKKGNREYKKDLSHIRLTIDEQEDLEAIRKVNEKIGSVGDRRWEEIAEFYDSKRGEWGNEMIKRNEGREKNTGQKMWKRATKVIGGGNMLLSKRPDIHLPDKWPTYYEKSEGCRVIDLDGNELKDLYLMGVGTNILGYANSRVDQKVSEAIQKGNMSTLNCKEEVLLAEKLVNIHPWSEKARFARTGGEANAIAVRLARAYTGKDRIAICGYHGWHDWYLATNIGSDENLAPHLLPGLNPLGVPSGLGGTVIPFNFNDLEGVKKVLEQNEIAAVKMEVERNIQPNEGFLEEIRAICSDKGIVLIFDECTSGFRETFGGLHKKYNVEPDMCILGKALGNGYAITAVLGKGDIMDKAEETFISSTFWTERIGSVAALETLDIMAETKSWEIITQKGKYVKSEWRKIAKEKGLSINITGLDALASFTIEKYDNRVIKTFILQEMLKRGFLAGMSLYVSVAHEDWIIKDYIKNLREVFEEIAISNNDDLIKSIEGKLSSDGFARLN